MDSYGEARRRPGSPAVAWTVLLLCVAAIVLLPWLLDTFVPVEMAAVEPVRPHVEEVLAGRMVVGLHHLGGRAGFEPMQRSARQTLDELAVTAHRPIDQLRVAVLEAELVGAGPARERLVAMLEVVDEQLATRAQRESELGGLQPPAELQRELVEQPGGNRDRTIVVMPTLELLQRDARWLLEIYEAEATLDDSQRVELIERHGWFGRLALTHERTEANAVAVDRGRVVGGAIRTVVVATVGGLGLLALLAVGLVLLVVAGVLWWQGRLRARYRPVRLPTTPFLEAMAVFLVLMIVLSIVLPLIMGWTGLPVTGLLYVLVPLAIFWPLLRGVDWPAWRLGVGWRRGRGVWREAGSGLVGYVAGLPVVAVGLVLTVLLAGVIADEPEHPIAEELFTGDFWQLLVAVSLAVIWAPIVEELIFRGAFYHHVRRHWNAAVSGLVVGVIFAAIHPQGLAGIPVLTAVALVFSFIREWRGSIIGPMVAHAVHNLGATLVMLLLLR